MITVDDFVTVLTGTGYPVAYLHFPVDEPPPTMPFITWQETGSDNFGADNRVWHSGMRLQVDLFTVKKDMAAERRLEEAFDNAELYWSRVVEWDDQEDCYRATYELGI